MLLHQLISNTRKNAPDAVAIIHNDKSWSYQELDNLVYQQSSALLTLGLKPQQRVAVYLPKQIETVSSFFSICQAGGVFVPINPILKAAQVNHTLTDCNVQILITSQSRLNSLQECLLNCPELHTIIVVDHKTADISLCSDKSILSWTAFINRSSNVDLPALIDTNMACILYTSGSTGKPKGVILSHRNIVAGAESVSEYLEIHERDNILAVLPFSFDYGLNQLTSTLLKGASCTLLDYLLPRDVIKLIEKNHITGLAAVPSLWVQLAKIEWPESINNHLRYMTNSGGKMPKVLLDGIQSKSPNTQFFLMYGLTEAFRSTFLPPDKLLSHPDSIGKAIPNVEIAVVREDGSLCEANEIGELVHKGSLVSMGYWNNPAKTAKRFKPAPTQLKELPITELAVWSGDQVTMDADGYLYFIGRTDDMLKTSGYRVSPTEIEDVIYSSGLVKEVAAIGLADDSLGQVIYAIVSPDNKASFSTEILMQHCKSLLANYMVPSKIIQLTDLPKTANGKIDRKKLATQFSN